MVRVGLILGPGSCRVGGGPAPSNPNFVSTWDTTKAGSASNTVVLPLLSGGVYSGTIDWGDGSSDPLSYANRTHVYASSGIYTITISGSDIQGFRFANGGDRRKILDVSNWGNLTITTDQAFYGCDNLDVSATDAPTISSTSLAFMFRFCKLTNFDASAFDVAGVLNMLFMFGGNSDSGGAKNQFNGNINNWDVSSCTNMQGMFSYTSHFNQPLDNWNVSNAVIGSTSPSSFGMFQGATAFNQNINNWNVSSKTDFGKLFNGAIAFNQPLDNWNVSSATSMREMFSGATSFNQDISGWDVSNVTNMFQTFYNCNSFNQDISGWNVSSVTSMAQMFQLASAFNQNIGSWNVGNVTSMYQMFYSALSFNNGGSPSINNWDVSSCTNMQGMFGTAFGNPSTIFNQPIGSWNTSNVTNMSYMFRDNDSFDQNISGWDITSVSSFSIIFGFMQLSDGLSTVNYDALLVGWEATLQAAYPSGVGYPYTININFGGSQYTSAGAGGTAKASLILTFGWTITDGGGI